MSETIKKKGLSMPLVRLKADASYLRENLANSDIASIESIVDLNLGSKFTLDSKVYLSNQNRNRQTNQKKQKGIKVSKQAIIVSENRRGVISLGKNSISSSLTKYCNKTITDAFSTQKRKSSLPFFQSQQIIKQNVQSRPINKNQTVYYRVQVHDPARQNNIKEIDKPNNQLKINENCQNITKKQIKENFFKKGDDALFKKIQNSKLKLGSELSLIPDFHLNRKQLKQFDQNKMQIQFEFEFKLNQKLQKRSKNSNSKASEFQIEKLLNIQDKIQTIITKSRQ